MRAESIPGSLNVYRFGLTLSADISFEDDVTVILLVFPSLVGLPSGLLMGTDRRPPLLREKEHSPLLCLSICIPYLEYIAQSPLLLVSTWNTLIMMWLVSIYLPWGCAISSQFRKVWEVKTTVFNCKTLRHILRILAYYNVQTNREIYACYSESIERFIESKAFPPSNDAASPPPLPPVSKLDWHTGRLRKGDNLLTGEGSGNGAKSIIIRRQISWSSINNSILSGVTSACEGALQCTQVRFFIPTHETLFFPCLPTRCLVFCQSFCLYFCLSVRLSSLSRSECLKLGICLLSVCPSVCLLGHSREYWMIYRGPGLLAVVWLPSTPSAVSNLSLFLSLPVCRQSSLFLGEVGEKEWARSWIIRRRKKPGLYK